MGGSDEVTMVLHRAPEAARLAGITVARLRRYEAAGLVAPARQRGRVRYYTTAQVALLRRIRRLHEELGVNLAGVEIILRLLARLEAGALEPPPRVR
ncbi:MAG: hypothetical protein C4290_03640 [Chloroflexota bacterium]